jgi:hypothetical protein
MQLLSLFCCTAKGVGVIIKYNSLPMLKSSLGLPTRSAPDQGHRIPVAMIA